MGPGIAQVMAQADYEVGGFDLNRDAYAPTRQVITNSMGLLIEAGLAKPEDQDEALAGISMGDSLEAAVSGAQIVVEVVSEKLLSLFQDDA